jgi:hypothetical protein
MNATAINYCTTGNNTLNKRRLVKFIFIVIYLCIYIINYKRVNTYFNKKNEEKERRVDVVNLEEDVIGFLKPEELVEDEVLEDEELVASSNEVEEEEVMETLHIYEFEGTGEQLRRLRAYNKKNDEETEDEYTSRIWSMAYKEDEETEAQKALSSVANKLVASEVVVSTNEIVAEPLEKDVNTWRTIEDGKCRYKGEWKNGLPNGKGIKHFYKTDSYIYGNFVDGFAEGYCKQTFEQTWEKMEPYYEGEFKRNNYQGKGEYHYGDGDYYKGEWKDGKYNGQGGAYSKRLDRTWVGEYKNDEKVEGNWVKGEI